MSISFTFINPLLCSYSLDRDFGSQRVYFLPFLTKQPKVANFTAIRVRFWCEIQPCLIPFRWMGQIYIMFVAWKFLKCSSAVEKSQWEKVLCLLLRILPIWQEVKYRHMFAKLHLLLCSLFICWCPFLKQCSCFDCWLHFRLSAAACLAALVIYLFLQNKRMGVTQIETQK